MVKRGRPRIYDNDMNNHIEGGKNTTICAWCHRAFSYNHHRTLYCGYQCQRAIKSARRYERQKGSE